MSWRRGAAMVGLAMLLAATAPAQQVTGGDGRRFYPDDPLWHDPDTLDIGEIEIPEFDLSMQYDFLENVLGDPGDYDGPALNVNTLGEVPDSSWWTNRIGLGKLSFEEVVRGPNQGDGPAEGVLRVVGRPGAGITPKFTIQDRTDTRYLIKIDPPEWPGLTSSVEFISTKLFWAMGYHTPENYIFYLDPDRLEIDPEATWRDAAGYRRPLRRQEIEEWLRGQAREDDGTIRVLASKFISGRPIGPFRVDGQRPDDLNDLYPHEGRRELRGYRAFSAWLAHDDSRALNSFNALVEQDGRRFVRHYLIDFGSTMGSRGVAEQEDRAGYEYMTEMDNVFKRMITLGLYREPWEKVPYRDDLPELGSFESEFYEPWLWRPQYPNPAFNRMDAADAFWAARIMSRFTPEMIDGIVGTAQIDDEARAVVTRVLVERLRKTVRYWLTRTTPLDSFAVEGGVGASRLRFVNAAIEAGAVTGPEAYEASFARLDNLAGKEEAVGSTVRLASAELSVPAEAWGSLDDAGDRYAIVRIAVDREGFPHWREPVAVTLRDRAGALAVVGIERPVHSAAFALEPTG